MWVSPPRLETPPCSLPGFCLAYLKKVVEGLERRFLRYHHRDRGGAEIPHGQEVLSRVERGILRQQDVGDDRRRRRRQHRVSVGIGIEEGGGPGQAASARQVLDHHRNLEFLGEGFRKDPRSDIETPSRRKRDDDLDLFGRKGVLSAGGRDGRRGDNGGHGATDQQHPLETITLPFCSHGILLELLIHLSI